MSANLAEQYDDGAEEALQHRDRLMFEKFAIEFFAEIRRLPSCIPNDTWITEKDVDNVAAGCLPHLWNQYLEYLESILKGAKK